MTIPPYTLTPIGTLETPFRTLADCPRNRPPAQPRPLCRARVFPEYVPGLASLEGFSHLILLYWLDRPTHDFSLVFTPPFDPHPRPLRHPQPHPPQPDRPLGGGVRRVRGGGLPEGAVSRLPRRHAAAGYQTGIRRPRTPSRRRAWAGWCRTQPSDTVSGRRASAARIGGQRDLPRINRGKNFGGANHLY